MIEIVAPNIKSGGGQVLLDYLISYLNKYHKNIKVLVHLDHRYNCSNFPKKQMSFKNYKSVFSKIFLFLKFKKNTLYFGNLPPLIKGENNYVYFHNTFLLATNKTLILSRKFKYLLQKYFLFLFSNNVSELICQTPYIKKRIIDQFSSKVDVIPFFNDQLTDFQKKIYDFCYISLDNPHKNHRNLLRAIEILSSKGIKFTFALTVPESNILLCERIKKINNAGVIRIFNFGVVNYDQSRLIMNKSAHLVFPSLEESFGLPLLEAVFSNTKVIAAQLPYVNEVIDASLYFDPLNPIDISEKMLFSLKNNLELSKSRVENDVEKLINKLYKNV
tara:strand:+ start:15 stop:1007 length:993 start_codon:yes stop_codon:yes gene_type:complete